MAMKRELKKSLRISPVFSAPTRELVQQSASDFNHQGASRSFITSKGQEVDAIFHGLVRIVGRSAIFVQGTPWRKWLAGSLSHHHLMEAHCGSSHIQNYRVWLGWNPDSKRIRPQD